MARAKFRSWHRGTREADYMIGGYFDAYHKSWNEVSLEWFEKLLDEEDVDIIAWVTKTAPTPTKFAGNMMEQMQKLNFIEIKR